MVPVLRHVRSRSPAPSVGWRLKSVRRHPPFFKRPVREERLCHPMVLALSAFARKKRGAKRFLAYVTGALTVQTMWVAPETHGFDYKDYALHNVFPNGSISVEIDTVPGTDMPLSVPWRVYIDTGRHLAPLNSCIQHKFGIEWPGNVVVIKHRRKSEGGHIAQVLYGEEDFADVIVGLWLKQFVHVKESLGLKLHFHSNAVDT